MNTQDFKRKLTAVFSADVAGYSRLMGEDEAATVKTLEAYKQIMFSLIKQHRGRVIDSPGDNLLAEFASVVDGVQCGVEIQNELKARNADLSENRRMRFRIGINLGDVIEEGERIYGDGVNIAARLEALADPGGICVSGTAFDQIKNKLSVGYQYLGKQTLKNIPDLIRAYKVLMEQGAFGKVMGEEEPEMEKRGSKDIPLPDKPSIAVLPFDNLSDNPQSKSLADAISESIIYALSYLPDMFVIARNSTLTYKGKQVKSQQVGEDLGVRYILEGSVMIAGDRVRVTASLVDGVRGYYIWSRRYDGGMKDLFGLLDDMTKAIAVELQVKVTDKLADLSRKTQSLDAWALASRAYGLISRGYTEDFPEARKLAAKAVELDPTYGYGWAVLAVAHTWEALNGLSESPAESIRLAAECNEKALNLDPALSCATASRGQIYLLQGKLDEAITFGKKAIAMAPSLDTNYLVLGLTMSYAGKFEEAVELFKEAIRLNPFPPIWYYSFLGNAYFMRGQHDEAIIALKRALQRNPDFLLAHIILVACYSSMGRDLEATNESLEILRIKPKFSVESYAKTLQYKERADIERQVAALRKAGLN